MKKAFVILCMTLIGGGLSAAPELIDVTDEAGLSAAAGSYTNWGDYNSDGYPDLLVGGDQLFRNEGPPDFNFSDVSEESKVAAYPSNGGVWGDYDNDGHLDIFAFTGLGAYPRLLHNNGDGTFSNVADTINVFTDTLDVESAAWGDYNSDGYLDIYMAGFLHFTSTGYLGPWKDHLYRNNGNKTFTEVSEEAGIWPLQRAGRCVTWADFDQDGDQDIFVGNYILQANILWRNNGDGTFTNVANDLGCAGTLKGLNYYGHTIAANWGDLDNDGWLDLFVANLAHKDEVPQYGNRCSKCDDSEILMSNGASSFTNIRKTSGIPVIPCNTIAPDGSHYRDELFDGSSLGDYDNDGDLDIYITQVYDLLHATSFLYSNNGNETWTDVTDSAPGHEMIWNGWGPSWCDYDLDGDLDLAAWGGLWDGAKVVDYRTRLSRNEGGNENNWIEVTPRAGETDYYPVGAEVYCVAGGVRQTRLVEGGTGRSCQNGFTVHFGLGSLTKVDSLTIKYPSGKTATLLNLAVNQIVEAREGITETGYAAAPSLNADRTIFGANLRFSISNASNKDIRVGIFDASGRLIALLTPEIKGDRCRALWQPGELIPSGVYFARLMDTPCEPVKIVYVK